MQLYEREYEGSNTFEVPHCLNVNEKEIGRIGLQESDADICLQIQEQYEQERMENSWSKNQSENRSENDISADDNNSDWSTENTQDSIDNITDGE